MFSDAVLSLDEVAQASAAAAPGSDRFLTGSPLALYRKLNVLAGKSSFPTPKSSREAEALYYPPIRGGTEEYWKLFDFLKDLLNNSLEQKLLSLTQKIGKGLDWSPALSVIFLDSKMHVYLSGGHDSRVLPGLAEIVKASVEKCSGFLIEPTTHPDVFNSVFETLSVDSSEVKKGCAERAFLSHLAKEIADNRDHEVSAGITLQIMPKKISNRTEGIFKTETHGVVKVMANGSLHSFKMLSPCSACTKGAKLKRILDSSGETLRSLKHTPVRGKGSSLISTASAVKKPRPNAEVGLDSSSLSASEVDDPRLVSPPAIVRSTSSLLNFWAAASPKAKDIDYSESSSSLSTLS